MSNILIKNTIIYDGLLISRLQTANLSLPFLVSLTALSHNKPTIKILPRKKLLGSTLSSSCL